MRTSHPLFFNQLYARVEPVGVAADWAVAATNTNVHTYEVAPVFSLVEAALLDKLARVIGFKQHDGLLVPGGSVSNIYGGLPQQDSISRAAVTALQRHLCYS